MIDNTNSEHSLRDDIRITQDILRLIHQLAPKALAVFFGQSLVEAVLPFISIVFSAPILNELLTTRKPEKLLMLISLALVLTLVFSFIRKFLNQAAKYQGQLIEVRLMQAMALKTTTMDFVHAENPKTHELRTLAYESRDINGGVSAHIRMLGTMLQDVISILFSFGLCGQLLLLQAQSDYTGILGFVAGPSGSIVLVTVMALAIVCNIVVNTKSGKMVYEVLKFNAPINRHFMSLFEVFGDYRFGKDIRLYNMAPMFIQELWTFVEDLSSVFLTYVRQSSIYQALSLSVSALATGCIYVFVSLKALAGVISIGNIPLYIGAINQFNNALASFATRLVHIRVACIGSEYYLGYLNLENTKETGYLPIPERPDGRYEIEFRNVSFSYPSSDTMMLKNISMKLNIGERLAVVGMNGAGKTTFIKLLCRLYDPTEGTILLNGVDIREIDHQAYFKLFSVVFQDFHLFAFPIGHNVAASEAPDEERVWQHLAEVGVEERVKNMPQGIDTYLYKHYASDGMEISGGEAQKMAIARALYKNAPFVILDEPTAALDPISEFDIYTAFDSLVGEKTAVYISHRLSSCRFCHDIAVFDDGRLVQRGNHDQLLQEEGGLYASLWEAQAQYYASEEEPEPASQN